MISTFSRHRPLALLASVVLAQVLLLAFQIKRNNDVRLVRYWAVELITPVQRAGTWTFAKIGGVWYGYISLHNARTENERLQSELGRLQLRNRQLETEAAETRRVSLLLNFREGHSEAPMIAAQVIGANADSSSHTLFINRGERDRVRRNLGVITPDGVVGKIVEVFPTTAQVLLINDKDSGVGALFEESRTHGVVKGSADPDPHMDYVVNDEKVHVGEIILTSGEDRIFPKGLLIGIVSSAAPGTPFQLIHVKSAARLDRLEDVLVLLSQQELAPKEAAGSSSVIPAGAVATTPAEQTGATPKSPASSPANKPVAAKSVSPAAGASSPLPGSQTSPATPGSRR